MQTKHFKSLTLKNTDTNIYLIPRHGNSKKTSLVRRVKNKIKFLLLCPHLHLLQKESII